MQVKAIRMGIDPKAAKRRRVGEVFDWDDKDWERLKGLKKTPSWVEPVGQNTKAAAASAGPAGKGKNQGSGGKGNAPVIGNGQTPATSGDNQGQNQQGGNSPDLPGA
jgi:hypothetical protein